MSAGTVVKKNISEMEQTVVMVREDMERHMEPRVESVYLLASSVLGNIREGRRENSYGPIFRAVYCLGKLAAEAEALSAKCRKTDDLKFVARDWALVAREVAEEIVNAA